MNRRRVIGIVLATHVVTLAVAAAVLGFIPGVSARVALADSERHFSLLAETMSPLDSSVGYDNTSAFLTTTADSTVVFPTTYVGQLDLPDGATIVSAVCWGLDTDPTDEFSFRIFRYSLWTSPVWEAVTEYAYSGVPFSGGTVELDAEVDPANAVVDNSEFSYGLILKLPKAQVGTSLGVLRCVVNSTYNLKLPLIQKK